jgi:hypothetical protein
MSIKEAKHLETQNHWSYANTFEDIQNHIQNGWIT